MIAAAQPDLENRVIGGWNIIDGNEDYDDVLGHGTLVAAVMAGAGDNSEGISSSPAFFR